MFPGIDEELYTSIVEALSEKIYTFPMDGHHLRGDGLTLANATIPSPS